jgi:hypothetical protein
MDVLDDRTRTVWDGIGGLQTRSTQVARTLARTLEDLEAALAGKS